MSALRQMSSTTALWAICGFLAATAQAGNYNYLAYFDELTVCVDALRGEVAGTGIRRIEHHLVKVEPRGAGYVFQIETRLYADSSPDAPAVSTTRSNCRAQGSERLIELDIDRPSS